MGCAFDSFSSSWTDRSYVLTLLVLAWLIPLVSNIVFYVSMIYRVRTSDFQYYVIKQAKQDCYQMFNVDNRVSNISFKYACNVDDLSYIFLEILWWIYFILFPGRNVLWLHYITVTNGNEISKNGLHNITRMVYSLDTICCDEFLGHVFQS